MRFGEPGTAPRVPSHVAFCSCRGFFAQLPRHRHAAEGTRKELKDKVVTACRVASGGFRVWVYETCLWLASLEQQRHPKTSALQHQGH